MSGTPNVNVEIEEDTGHLGARGPTDSQTVLRVAGGTETTLGNTQDWLQLEFSV
jgi:hypothetical protein